LIDRTTRWGSEIWGEDTNSKRAILSKLLNNLQIKNDWKYNTSDIRAGGQKTGEMYILFTDNNEIVLKFYIQYQNIPATEQKIEFYHDPEHFPKGTEDFKRIINIIGKIKWIDPNGYSIPKVLRNDISVPKAVRTYYDEEGYRFGEDERRELDTIVRVEDYLWEAIMKPSNYREICDIIERDENTRSFRHFFNRQPYERKLQIYDQLLQVSRNIDFRTWVEFDDEVYNSISHIGDTVPQEMIFRKKSAINARNMVLFFRDIFRKKDGKKAFSLQFYHRMIREIGDFHLTYKKDINHTYERYVDDVVLERESEIKEDTCKPDYEHICNYNESIHKLEKILRDNLRRNTLVVIFLLSLICSTLVIFLPYSPLRSQFFINRIPSMVLALLAIVILYLSSLFSSKLDLDLMTRGQPFFDILFMLNIYFLFFQGWNAIQNSSSGHPLDMLVVTSFSSLLWWSFFYIYKFNIQDDVVIRKKTAQGKRYFLLFIMIIIVWILFSVILREWVASYPLYISFSDPNLNTRLAIIVIFLWLLINVSLIYVSDNRANDTDRDFILLTKLIDAHQIQTSLNKVSIERKENLNKREIEKALVSIGYEIERTSTRKRWRYRKKGGAETWHYPPANYGSRLFTITVTPRYKNVFFFRTEYQWEIALTREEYTEKAVKKDGLQKPQEIAKPQFKVPQNEAEWLDILDEKKDDKVVYIFKDIDIDPFINLLLSNPKINKKWSKFANRWNVKLKHRAGNDIFTMDQVEDLKVITLDPHLTSYIIIGGIYAITILNQYGKVGISPRGRVDVLFQSILELYIMHAMDLDLIKGYNREETLDNYVIYSIEKADE
jgi:hypothetical protein